MRCATVILLLLSLPVALPAQIPTATGALLPLCFEKLVQLEKNDELLAHFTYMRLRVPSVLSDIRVQSLCIQIFNPDGGDEAKLESARKRLKAIGGGELLTDTAFQKAFRAFAFEARMFDKLNIHNLEAQKYFVCIRLSNNAKACLNGLKAVAGAAEMYHLDEGTYPTAKTSGELIGSLLEARYLGKKMEACCPEGQSLELHVAKDGYPQLSCPVHGTPDAPINPKFPLSPPEFRMVEESNVVIAAQLELAKRRKQRQ